MDELRIEQVLEYFSKFEVGDYVTHPDFGIGQYDGEVTKQINGEEKTFLRIIYDKGEVLYVPAEKRTEIQKYVGVTDEKPKLTKLRSKQWKKAKAKVKRAIGAIIKELIELYAKRQITKGYAFPPDSPKQKEFEQKFPYQLTEGQAKAIEEIKADMEKPVPMDRLLCGDVGSGKTEVAMRAVFKAVDNKKQVAVLCPTSVLAYQHYKDFVKRFEGFNVNIALLNSFITVREQEEVIKRLADGTIDIVIGTHKLLQDYVKFKDLGLVVIDEEQRFGVMHKEKIKMYKETVDVLSLSATPIPRTLQMTILGLRDVSVIKELPHNRQPVTVSVLPYDEAFVKNAILKELDRGGQVYFVYNRVKNIEEIVNHVKKLVPKARIGIAHGQMDTEELEQVMYDFVRHNYDILVATTIVEIGVNVPNANTMIIYEADKFGLSQLYQLRGRVGRGDREAYVYLTYLKDKIISDVAKIRLKTMQDFAKNGVGLDIAMKDLEIRGAGNLLGTEQHGFVNAVGYALYLKILNEAIQEYKKKT